MQKTDAAWLQTSEEHGIGKTNLGSTNDGSEGALGLHDGTLEVVELLLDCNQQTKNVTHTFLRMRHTRMWHEHVHEEGKSERQIE